MSSRTTSRSLPLDYKTHSAAELIEACTGGNAAAWQEFMRRFHSIIAITASRAARRWGEATPQTIDDLVQETYLKLCANRGHALQQFRFEHDGAIFGFLKIITANVANDYFKVLNAHKRGGNMVSAPLDGSEISDTDHPAGLSDPERALLIDRVDACLCDMAPAETKDRDRRIFWLYYRHGMTAKEIAWLPYIGLTLKGVQSTLHRLIHLVRTHLTAAPTAKTASGSRVSERRRVRSLRAITPCQSITPLEKVGAPICRHIKCHLISDIC
jgi:RNA polymerase sigma-70 factor (ECF subfamily)